MKDVWIPGPRLSPDRLPESLARNFLDDTVVPLCLSVLKRNEQGGWGLFSSEVGVEVLKEAAKMLKGAGWSVQAQLRMAHKYDLKNRKELFKTYTGAGANFFLALFIGRSNEALIEQIAKFEKNYITSQRSFSVFLAQVSKFDGFTQAKLAKRLHSDRERPVSNAAFDKKPWLNFVQRQYPDQLEAFELLWGDYEKTIELPEVKVLYDNEVEIRA